MVTGVTPTPTGSNERSGVPDRFPCRAAIRRNEVVTKSTMTVMQFFDEWMPARFMTRQLKPSTQESYREQVEGYIKSRIGTLRSRIQHASVSLADCHAEPIRYFLFRPGTEMPQFACGVIELGTPSVLFGNLPVTPCVIYSLRTGPIFGRLFICSHLMLHLLIPTERRS